MNALTQAGVSVFSIIALTQAEDVISFICSVFNVDGDQLELGLE